MTDLRKDLARALGVSAATVTRDAAAGMPTHSLEAARAWRAENRRPRAAPPPRAGAAGMPEGATATPPASLADDDDSGGDYWASRARRERAEADLAELKLAELRGELVRASAVRASIAKLAAGLREALLQMPSRLVPVLAADPDPARMEIALRAEIVAALQQITGGV